MAVSHAAFQRQLLRWYDTSQRSLPWRTAPCSTHEVHPDAYAVLVSELMLQQTQVATVIPYFNRFMQRFPTPFALASADEQEVLRHWQGLGYYSRARNLHAAAKAIVLKHDGKVPAEVDALLQLPGVGRYTAGAVASIAFGRRAPILDGNVARVLCRIEKIESDPRDVATREKLWHKAEEILPDCRIGEFNSALMELGAMVCTPRAPRCLLCPVRDFCKAFAAGVQEQIPAPRKARPTPLHRRWTLCLQHKNRWLIEQRPPKGRWAGLWQFVTFVPKGRKPTPEFVMAQLGLQCGPLDKLGVIAHSLTHRRYRFDVFAGTADTDSQVQKSAPIKWVTLEELDQYPLPRPHLKIAEMLEGL